MSCAFPDSRDLKVDWSRWFHKAVWESAKQVRGAERWLRQHSDRVFVDNTCMQRLPLALDHVARCRFHRVIVARGAQERCKTHLGGSGSLTLAPGIAGKAYFDLRKFDVRPFCVGRIDSAPGHLHVFDDVTLPLVLREADTSGRAPTDDEVSRDGPNDRPTADSCDLPRFPSDFPPASRRAGPCANTRGGETVSRSHFFGQTQTDRPPPAPATPPGREAGSANPGFDRRFANRSSRFDPEWPRDPTWLLVTAGLVLAATPLLFMALAQRFDLGPSASFPAFLAKLAAFVCLALGPGVLAAGLVFPAAASTLRASGVACSGSWHGAGCWPSTASPASSVPRWSITSSPPPRSYR